MSLTSAEATQMDCPKSMWHRKCVGNRCPLWIVERMPTGKGAVACEDKSRRDGSFYDFMEYDPVEFEKCFEQEVVDNCIKCDFAYGHCAG